MRRKKSKSKFHHQPHDHSSYSWLPIDYRLIPDIFSFGQVKGVARIFLLIEIVLSVFVVSISITLFLLSVFRIF